jgi:hypothetical protein
MKSIQIDPQRSRSWSEFNCPAVAEHRKSLDRGMTIHSNFKREGFTEPDLDSKLNV